MEEVLSKDVQAGLQAAVKLRAQKRHRLRIVTGDRIIPVRRIEKTGLAVELSEAANLPGIVDVFDGSRHLFQCLIVADAQEGDEMFFAFKRATPIATKAAADFELAEGAPIALLSDDP